MGAKSDPISKGDVVLDSVYLGEVHGMPINETTLGIVLEIKDNKVLIYWFDRRSHWGVESPESEWFDLNKESDVSILRNMREEYVERREEF